MTRNAAIRYEVQATAANQEVFSSFLSWMVEEHGPELLQVAGCYEFRLYEIAPLIARCEYLFTSEKALHRYLESTAPTLRAKGLAKFPQGVTFDRSQSRLLTTRSKSV